jgi:hypothetical protein
MITIATIIHPRRSGPLGLDQLLITTPWSARSNSLFSTSPKWLTDVRVVDPGRSRETTEECPKHHSLVVRLYHSVILPTWITVTIKKNSVVMLRLR